MPVPGRSATTSCSPTAATHPRRTVVGQRYKLVQALSFEPAPPAPFELDLLDDPGETTDLAGRRPEVVERLTADYDRWFADVSASRGYHPVRFAIGSDRQPHAHQAGLAHDAAGRLGPEPGRAGHWEVEAPAGPYDVTVTFANPAAPDATATIAFRGLERSIAVAPGAEQVRFDDVSLEPGEGRFEARVTTGADLRGAWHVDLVRR